jgi:ABC-type branched-subunit amino acid transport system substrate-binding protein
MRIARWHQRFLIALVLAPALPAWPSPAALAGEKSEVIVRRDPDRILIGVSSVQTGPASEMGRNLISGSRAYFDEVNRLGGINGRSIAILLKDDHYEPDPAVQNTNDFIQGDQVLFLFDYVGTPTLTRTLPLLKYYSGKQLVSVGPLTGAEPQRQPPYDRFVFNIRASYREETRTLVNYFYSKGYRRIGVLAQADAYGKSGQSGVEDALAALGLAVVANASYRRNQPFESKLEVQVKILRDAGADAVIAVGVFEPSAAFIRDARMSGWNVPIANLSPSGSSAMLRRLKQTSVSLGTDLTTNLIVSQVVPPPDDLRYPLVVGYCAHTEPNDRSFTGLEGWLNAAVVTEALRRAGPNPSRGAFIAAMESLHGWDPGLGVAIAFSPTDHQGLHKVWLTRTARGIWVPEALP